MNTDPIPRHAAVRLVGFAIGVAGLAGGAILLAQQAEPPVAAPAVEAPATVVPPPAPPPAPPSLALPAAPSAVPSAGLAPDPVLPAQEPRVAVPPPTPGGPALGPPRALPVPVAPRRVSASASSGAVSIEAAPGRGRGPARISSDPRPAPTPAQPKAGGRTTGNLARTVVDEELSADPHEIIRDYETMIADFDSQREDAAQAVVRLGEAYRKLGRLEEARVQFARVLREFVDFPELARLSQQQLAQHTPLEARAGGAVNLPPHASAEERTLLEEELALLGQQLARAQELVKTGTAPESSLFPIQRDILHLKQQLARLPKANPNINQNAPSSNSNRGGDAEVKGGQVVIVGGGIRQPGAVDFRPGIKICDMIVERGGLDPSGNAGRVRLVRSGKTRELDLSDISSDQENNVILEAGDMIIVPRSPSAQEEKDSPTTTPRASN